MQARAAVSLAPTASTLHHTWSLPRFGASGAGGGAKTGRQRSATVSPSISGALSEASVDSATGSHGSFRLPLPNPSFKPTRYGSRRKPGLRQVNYRRIPGLRRLPPQAA